MIRALLPRSTVRYEQPRLDRAPLTRAILIGWLAIACRSGDGDLGPTDDDGDPESGTTDTGDPACGGLEVPYDGQDNDCDPETPDDDLDADGLPLAEDCDDEDPSIPSDEVVGDGVDNDCDGAEGCNDPEIPAGAEVVWEGDASGPDILEICRDAGTSCAQLEVTGDVTLTRTPTGLTCLAVVGGDLAIGVPPTDSYGSSRSEIHTLADLRGLRSVGGSVTVQYTEGLRSLDGLQELDTIGGSLWIEYNDTLATLDGLDTVSSLGGDLYFFANSHLTSIRTLSSLPAVGGAVYLASNALDSIEGLEGLTSVGVSQGWLGGGLRVQEEGVRSLTPLAGLTAIPGELMIGCPAVTSLDGLQGITSIGGSLDLLASVTSLGELSGVRSVGGDLTVEFTEVTSLAGLEGITAVRGLTLRFNPRLTSLDGLGGLTTLDSLSLWENDALTSIAALGGVGSIVGSVAVLDNDALTSLVGLDGVPTIGGDLHVGGTTWDGDGNDALASLAGLGSVAEVGGDLILDANDALTSLAGLEALRDVGGELRIGGFAAYYVYDDLGNHALSDVTALYGLESVARRVEITHNVALTDAAAQALVDEIELIGGRVVVHDNE